MKILPARVLLPSLFLTGSASLLAAGTEGYFVAERLVIHGQDVTRFNGYAELEVLEDGVTRTDIELAFALRPRGQADAEKLVVACRTEGGLNGWLYGSKPHVWNPDCEYDRAAGRGVFRIRRFPLMRRAHYAFSVDVSKVGPGAPQTPAYEFHIRTYPSLPDVGMASLPFYAISDQPRDFFLDWPTVVYANMNRRVAANTSLFFTLSLPPEFWPADGPVAKHLRIFLVKMEAAGESEAFRPLRVVADLPRGAETLLYDGPASAARNGFTTQAIRDRGKWLVWIRHPAPGRPDYENADYLDPGCGYSVQFELSRPPYAGKRYEATRFRVRPEVPKEKCEIVADYDAPNFLDWHGDWYNGHLLPTNNVPSPMWGQDFILQKKARDLYPDLWRTIHFEYLNESFSTQFNTFLNLFRDRSLRAVVKAEREATGEWVLTLRHGAGAEHFHDPDNVADTLASHPVVADGTEAIYRPGDLVFIQRQDRQHPPGSTVRTSEFLEAKVKATRPEGHQIVLEMRGELWPIQPEAAPKPYPAILGPVGSEPTTITLPANYTGTYLRQRNGQPYVNWGILNHTFDFFVHTMGLRVSIERYGPCEFVGDAFTGQPSHAGWQLVSDCEYYLMRHLLRRHRAGLDTFIHPIFGEGTWRQGGPRFVALYDYYADGILRAYEEVLGVRGEDYRRIRIGLGGLHLRWNLEYAMRWILAHALPAPLETVFPETCPAQPFPPPLPSRPLGSNPLYYFTPKDRKQFREQRWDFNACFLDEAGNPIVGPADWDAQGRLTESAIRRLQPTWRHSRWLLDQTRFGKGTPFRSVSVEGYGYPSEELANCVLFEKELLAQLDRNLQAASRDPHVQTYLQGVSCGTIQLALFAWDAAHAAPIAKPFHGTGYWPAYFADVMRRIVSEAARQPPGIFNVGMSTFDTFIAPDTGNSGSVSDTASFAIAKERKTARVPLADGKWVEVATNTVTLEKDIRHFVRFLGMMTHRLAALPERNLGGHVVSGLISKRWDNPPAGVEAGNGPDDAHRFYVLLYDHYPPDLESQDRLQIPVRLRVRNLPRPAQSARVMIYRIDREHSSLYPLTERSDHVTRRAAHSPFNPLIYSPDEIAALRRAAELSRDDSFAENGGRFRVTDGALDLDLTLGANRVLFAEIDWE